MVDVLMLYQRIWDGLLLLLYLLLNALLNNVVLLPVLLLLLLLWLLLLLLGRRLSLSVTLDSMALRTKLPSRLLVMQVNLLDSMSNLSIGSRMDVMVNRLVLWSVRGYRHWSHLVGH